MKYLLFGGDQYYPLGGWQDYKGSFEKLLSALRVADSNTLTPDLGPGKWDWWQIVDLETGKIVKEGTSVVKHRHPDQEDD